MLVLGSSRPTTRSTPTSPRACGSAASTAECVDRRPSRRATAARLGRRVARGVHPDALPARPAAAARHPSDTFETAVTWDRFRRSTRAVMGAVREALGEPCRVTCRFTHVYPDGPAPYITVIAPARRGDEVAQWHEMKQAAGEAIIAGGGTITHHHAVGRDHRPLVRRPAARRVRRGAAGGQGRRRPGGRDEPRASCWTGSPRSACAAGSCSSSPCSSATWRSPGRGWRRRRGPAARGRAARDRGGGDLGRLHRAEAAMAPARDPARLVLEIVPFTAGAVALIAAGLAAAGIALGVVHGGNSACCVSARPAASLSPAPGPGRA